MDLINVDVNNETNVNWIDNGEALNADVLNRPAKEVAGFVNTLKGELDTLKNSAADDSFLSALLFGGE